MTPRPPQIPRAPGPPAVRAGLTLIELSVSLAVVSIVLGAIGSTVVLVTHAVPGAGDPATRTIAAGRVGERLTAELSEAIHICQWPANAITFTVADRDADGSPERICYSWSGTPGEPLTRAYNGGAAVTVVQDVHEFQLTYDLKTVSEEYPGPFVESAEVYLSGYDPVPADKEFSVDDKHWIGQYCKPTLPPEAITWAAKRILFTAMGRGGITGTTKVQLRLADGNALPTDTVLQERVMNEWELSSVVYTWREFSFDGASGLSPGDGLCLVLEWIQDAHSASILYDDEVPATAMVTTDNAGDTWRNEAAKAIVYHAYGTYTTAGAPQTVSRQYVTNVRIAMQVGGEAVSRIDTAARMLNTPEVLSAVWQADFSTDPTVLDFDGNGSSDWTAEDGDFDTARLSDGVWAAKETIHSNPDNDHVELTTVDVRFRDTTAGGEGAAISVRVDRAGSVFGQIRARVFQEAGGTQTVLVEALEGVLPSQLVLACTGLTSGFVDLHLLVDPDLDTVSIWVNGQHRATATYPRYSDILPPGVQLFPSSNDTGAQFDHVRIRVGGND